MDKEKLIRRLMTTFLGEFEEHLRALERDLLALDKDSGERRTELLGTLFRTAHSLKGASRSVNLRGIEAACHELEGTLGALRDGSRQLTPEILQLLFTATDALKDTERRLRAKESLEHTALQAVVPKLEAAGRGVAGDAPPAAAPARIEAPPVAAAEGRGFARVSTGKLDVLVARSGELLVARRRATARQDDVAAIRATLQRCRAEWQKLEKPVRKAFKISGGANLSRDDPDQGRRGHAVEHAILPRRAALALDRTAEALRKLDRGLEQLASRMANDYETLEQAAAPLEEDIRRIRMVPFADACEGLERAVRDIARVNSKEVDLVIEGGNVELDRAVLERLKDPLLHLVRNAVDHGVEPSEERRASGKSPRATVTVAAALRGGRVEIVVHDDGRGIDLGAVREQARRRKMTTPEDDREAARFVLLPGFSTARLITELSGRGVGLDVVKHRVESLHGHVDFSSEPGRGARFVLTVPLTLTTIRALLLQAGGHVYALPMTSVQRLARVGASDVGSIEGRPFLLSDGAPIAMASLVDVLGHAGGEPHRAASKACVAVIVSGDRQVALAVDELLAEQDVVVKGLGARLRRVKHFSGATVLPTGRLALILTPADLVESATRLAPRASLIRTQDDARSDAAKRLLVVDDSVTTRSLEKSILEAAGYDVTVAVDGDEAWQLLQEKGAELVITDVEMPRMDGFALCEAIRGSKRFRDLPVVLVTALESDRDKARGLEVGADAYLPKGAFDQRQLLETVARLI